ncbi:MAG: hypothetical protein ACI358_01560 [Candidatus Limimorpha sp.]
MDNKITIQKENLLNAYNKASGEQKKLLENIFGKDMFRKDINIKERVKTFEDAVAILGNDNQSVIDYYAIAEATYTKDIIAFAKLRVITEALNERWEPKFDGEEYRYYPWYYTYSKDEYDNLEEEEKKKCRVVGRGGYNAYAHYGLVYASAYDASSVSYTHYGSRLAIKTRELAEYCGNQFIEYLGRISICLTYYGGVDKNIQKP